MRRLTIALLTLLAFPASAAAVFPGENGPIVFTAGNTIGRINADGSGLQPVTDVDHDEVSHDDVTASADGSRLAFQFSVDVEEGEESPPPALGTTALDADPGYAPLVPTTLRVSEPAFLATDRVVYRDYTGSNYYQLFSARADGTDVRQETAFVQKDMSATDPVAAPDGDRVYYRARRYYQEVSPQGTEVTVTDYAIWWFRFSDNASGAVTPWARNQVIRPLDVSPDGGKLLYAVGDGPMETMQERDLGPGGSTRLARATPVTSASYSPDGEYIAYALADADDSIWDIRVKNAGDLQNDHSVPFPPGQFVNGNARNIEWALPSTSGITVTETGDGADTDDEDGVCDDDDEEAGAQCSLRAAIETVNAEGEAATIEFDVGDGGPQTLTVGSELPAITETVDAGRHDAARLRRRAPDRRRGRHLRRASVRRRRQFREGPGRPRLHRAWDRARRRGQRGGGQLGRLQARRRRLRGGGQRRRDRCARRRGARDGQRDRGQRKAARRWQGVRERAGRRREPGFGP